MTGPGTPQPVQSPRRATLPKPERLYLRDAVQALFREGKGVGLSEIRVIYRMQPLPAGQPPVQVLFTAPRKWYKRAHDRNLLKRRLREAYRQQKHPLYDQALQAGIQLHLALVHQARQAQPYSVLFARVGEALQRMQRVLGKQAAASARGEVPGFEHPQGG